MIACLMWICYFCEVVFYVHKQAKTPAFDMLLQLKSHKKVIIKIDALTLALLKDTFSDQCGQKQYKIFI